MASGNDIRAGKAFVELYVKNSALMKGLNQAQKRLQDFGNGISLVGKWMMGLGAMAIAPLTAMAARFESTGSALNDMAGRTGMSTEALSELGYAANQTGAEIEDVEKSIRKMQKAIADAASGGKAGKEALADLGLTVSELKNLSPDKQFDLIASKLGAIQNPTQKAAAAMAIFGKSGTSLLPMIDDLAVLRARAQELGLVMSKEDAAAADAFGDALVDLKKTVLGAGNGIMATLAPSLTKFVLAATNAVVQAKKWATENAGLIITVMKVAGGIMTAGVALFAFGKIIAGVGAVLGGLSGFIMWAAGGVQMLVSVLGMAISPALLIGAALTAAGVALIYLARNTAPVQAVGAAIAEFANGIYDMVSTLVGDVMTAWEGIGDALSAGDIGAAFKVITTTLSLEWARVTSWLTETWQGFTSIWQDITDGITYAWIDITASIKSAWYSMIGYLTKLWEQWKVSTFEEGLADKLAPIFARIQGVSVEETKKALTEDFARGRKALPERTAEIDEQTKRAKGQVEIDRKTQKDSVRQGRAVADQGRADKIAAAQKALDEALKGRDSAVGAAREARVKAESENAKKKAPAFGAPDLEIAQPSKALKSVVTFSAAEAAGQAGGGKNLVAEHTKRLTEQQIQTHRLLENINKSLEKMPNWLQLQT